MNDVESICETALRRIADVHAELGYSREVVALWALPRNDAVDLWRLARDSGARRVLEVGSFVGTSALLMAHALPDATIHSVDPNLALDIEFNAMGAKGDAADLSRRTLEIARLATQRLGFAGRVHFHEGGFAVGESFALADAPVPVIGPALCAREGPFDLAYVDGLHFEEAVHADVSLAAHALAPRGTIVLHDCIGYWGSHVRRAVSRVLETDDSLSFEHAPYGDLLRAIGTLSRNARTSPPLAQRAERCFGDVRGLSQHVARLLRSIFAGARFEARDSLAAAVVSHLRGIEAAPRVVIALDALDALEPRSHDGVLRSLADGSDAIVLGLTPPGEIDAAGAWSRPLARHVARLAAIGFECHDLLTPFLEPYTHAFGGGSPIARRTSFLLDSIVAVRRGSALAARFVDRAPLTSDAARMLTDQRLQLLFAARSYADVRRRYQEVHDSAAALRVEADRQYAEAQRLGNLVADWSAWRIHIGRLRFWRRA